MIQLGKPQTEWKETIDSNIEMTKMLQLFETDLKTAIQML